MLNFRVLTAGLFVALAFLFLGVHLFARLQSVHEPPRLAAPRIEPQPTTTTPQQTNLSVPPLKSGPSDAARRLIALQTLTPNNLRSEPAAATEAIDPASIIPPVVDSSTVATIGTVQADRAALPRSPAAPDTTAALPPGPITSVPTTATPPVLDPSASEPTGSLPSFAATRPVPLAQRKAAARSPAVGSPAVKQKVARTTKGKVAAKGQTRRARAPVPTQPVNPFSALFGGAAPPN